MPVLKALISLRRGQVVGKLEVIPKCNCEKSDDIEQIGSSEANLIWVSNDKMLTKFLLKRQSLCEPIPDLGSMHW